MVELLLLAAALSADNFAVSIGYGSSNTRISPGMTALLNLFCSAALVASAQFGKRFLQSAGPEWGTRVGAGCFFLMGTLKIFEELRKRRRKKQGKPETRLEHLEKQLLLHHNHRYHQENSTECLMDSSYHPLRYH